MELHTLQSRYRWGATTGRMAVLSGCLCMLPVIITLIYFAIGFIYVLFYFCLIIIVLITLFTALASPEFVALFSSDSSQITEIVKTFYSPMDIVVPIGIACTVVFSALTILSAARLRGEIGFRSCIVRSVVSLLLCLIGTAIYYAGVLTIS